MGELHGSPSNTMWPGPRSIPVPSSILIHPAVIGHGDPARPPPKEAHMPPIFGPRLLRPNGWMNQVRCSWPQPRPHCVRWGDGTQLLPPAGRHRSLPHFSAQFFVTERLDGSGYHLVWRWASGDRRCLKWGPIPSRKGAEQPPHFSADFALTRSPISAAADRTLVAVL